MASRELWFVGLVLLLALVSGGSHKAVVLAVPPQDSAQEQTSPNEATALRGVISDPDIVQPEHPSQYWWAQLASLGGCDFTGIVKVEPDGRCAAYQGLVRYPNGSKYDGSFEDGLPAGWGTYSSQAGDRLTGRCSSGKLYGPAIYTKSNGTHLAVEYFQDKLLTQAGTTVYDNKTVQSGSWDSRTETGKGIIEWSDGRRYMGPWRIVIGHVDVPEGEGCMTWKDGRTYVGEFKDGLPHGVGKMIYEDVRCDDGIWQKGIFTGSIAATTRPAE